MNKKDNKAVMENRNKFEDFNYLYTNYQKRFVRFANSYVRDLPVAEDIVIDSMMYYWENRHNLEPETKIPAYVLVTIKNKCLNHLQHLQVRDDYSEKLKQHTQWELNLRISTLEAFNPYELFTKEIQEIIDKTLVDIPEQTRRIFIMSRYENLSNKEIAGQLNLTIKGVEYHISKILNRLRKELNDYLPSFMFFL